MNPFFQVLPALTMTAMNANRKAIKANRKEKYVTGWKKLQEDTDIDPTINFISCDTRDFDVYMCNEYPKMDDFQMDQWKHFEKTFIDEDFVIGILNELKRATGGDGDWRHITTVDGHWLKYIWFVRANDTQFVMLSKGYGIIDKSQLFEIIDWSSEYVKTK